MAVREVLRMGHPVLRERAKRIENVGTPELRALVQDMKDTMAAKNGAGLAAPQIGVGQRVVIFGVTSNPRYPDAEEVPFTVLAPEDDAALAGLNLDAANWNDVAQVAAKHRVSEVGLVQAVYANGKMTVNIRRLGAGEQPTKTSVEVPMLQTVGTTYPAAAQAAVRAIEDMWKTRSVIDFSQRGRLTADVRIGSLAQWGEIQTALGQISNVTGVTVTAISPNFARINMGYQGGLDQLREAVGEAGLSLTNRGGQWTLARAGQ